MSSVVLPFVAPFIFGVFLQEARRDAAVDQVTSIARAIAHGSAVAGKPAQLDPAGLERAAIAIVSARYAHDPTGTDALRFRAVALALANDLRESIKKPDDQTELLVQRLRHRFDDNTRASFTQLAFFQGFLMFAVPALLLANVVTIRRRMKARGTTSIERSENARDERMLADAKRIWYVLTRLSLGFLLLLGTTYILSPNGLMSSYVLGIADLHPIPGHTSHPLWITQVADAPVIVVGFVGFFLYLLIVTAQRFWADDLDDRFLLSLLIRGVIVMILSFALGATAMSEQLARLLVFVAGVFPIRALEAIANKVQVTIDPEFAAPAGFEGLPHLSNHLTSAFRAHGWESTHQLASLKPSEIIAKVRVHPALLGRILDRAVVIDLAGFKLFQTLEDHGLGSVHQILAIGVDEIEKLPESIRQPALNVHKALHAANVVVVDDGAVRSTMPALALAERVQALRQWTADKE